MEFLNKCQYNIYSGSALISEECQFTINGIAGVKGGKSPRNGKNCSRKMMLFAEALFVATTFPKILKNSIFLLNFH